MLNLLRLEYFMSLSTDYSTSTSQTDLTQLDLKDPHLESLNSDARAVLDFWFAEDNEPYWFAQNVKGADVRAHGRVIINSGDPEWNELFASNVKGADVRSHTQIIMDINYRELNYKFVRDIKGTYGIDKDVDLHNQIESELESLDNYLDDAVASSEKDASKSMTK